MAELALLQFGDRRISGLVGAPGKDAAVVQAAFAEAFPKAFGEMTTAERVEALRGIFEKHGFKERRVSLVVPRRFALIREIIVPPGTPDEAAGMIRFQLEKELPLPIDQVYYNAWELRREGDKIRMLAAAVPHDALALVTGALQALGIKVQSAYLSTAGLAALVPASAETIAVESIFDDHLEVAVLKEGKIVGSTNEPVTGMTDAEIGGHLNRSIMSYLSRASEEGLGKVVLADDRVRMYEQMMFSGEKLDLSKLVQGPTTPMDAAPLVGVALGLARGAAAVADLLHPHMPKTGLTKIATPMRIAGLAAAAVVLALVYGFMAVADVEDELAVARNELRTKQARMPAVEKTKREAALAGVYTDRRPQWTEALRVLSTLIDTKDIFLTDATLSEDGTVSLRGRGRRGELVNALVTQMNKSGLFVNANASNLNDLGGREDYRIDFRIQASVKK